MGGGVGVGDLAIGIDHQHALLQDIKHPFKQPALAAKALGEGRESGRIEGFEPLEHAFQGTGFFTATRRM